MNNNFYNSSQATAPSAPFPSSESVAANTGQAALPPSYAQHAATSSTESPTQNPPAFSPQTQSPPQYQQHHQQQQLHQHHQPEPVPPVSQPTAPTAPSVPSPQPENTNKNIDTNQHESLANNQNNINRTIPNTTEKITNNTDENNINEQDTTKTDETVPIMAHYRQEPQQPSVQQAEPQAVIIDLNDKNNSNNNNNDNDRISNPENKEDNNQQSPDTITLLKKSGKNNVAGQRKGSSVSSNVTDISSGFGASASSLSSIIPENESFNQGYCIVFLRKTKYFELFINGYKLALKIRTDITDADIDKGKEIISKFDDCDNLLSNFINAEIKYRVQYSLDENETHVIVIVSISHKIIGEWIDSHNYDLPIDSKEAIKVGRRIPQFTLARRTWLETQDDDRNFRDPNIPDTVFSKLPISTWDYIHVNYDSTINSRIYQKHRPNNTIIHNRLYLRVLFDVLTENVAVECFLKNSFFFCCVLIY